MADFEGFHLNMQPIEEAKVVDIETGETVDRPDIARRAAGFMSEAVERAGGTISIDPSLEAQIRSIDIDDTPKDK
jgi:hypothetical protein